MDDIANQLTLIYVLLTAGLFLSSVVFGWRAYSLQKELGERTLSLQQLSVQFQRQQAENTARIEQMREFRRNTRMLEYQYVNVILFGPRYAGKTSIVELWTKPWADIASIEASSTWRTYEVSIHEFFAEQRHDYLFDVDCIFVPTLRLKIWDYPGDERYRVPALANLEKLTGHTVLLFVFNLSVHNEEVVLPTDNSSYYSVVFVEEIKKILETISDKVARVFVVFNKIDLLPKTWDDTYVTQRLRNENARALSHIEHLFSGKLDYRMTSAETNEGLITLLGDIGGVAISSASELDRFKANLNQIQKEKQDLTNRI